jgi:hypothetical protein
MNPNHYGKTMGWWVGVRHVNVEVQAILAAHDRADTVLELRADVAELRGLKQPSEARRWLWREPAQISHWWRGIRNTEILMLPRHCESFQRTLIGNDGAFGKHRWRAAHQRRQHGR